MQDDSRRGFLKTVGALPAAMAAMPNGAVAADEPKLPLVKFGKYSISRMICGSNPFGGLSHLSTFINYEMRQYYTPDQIVKTLHHCQEEGITACQGLRPDLYKKFTDEGGKIHVFANGQNNPARIEATAKSGAIGMHHFGVTTDVLYKQGKIDEIGEFLKRARDTGLLTGVCTHIPAVVDVVESKGWDFDYWMLAVYQWGRTKEELEKMFGDRRELLPVETYNVIAREGYSEVFLNGDPERMYKMIRQVKKPTLAYKILAAGRKCENPKFVEQAFKEAFENIKPTDSIIVGFWPRYTDQIAEDAEFVRRYGTLKNGA